MIDTLRFACGPYLAPRGALGTVQAIARRLRPIPARGVRDALVLGLQRAFVRGAIVVAIATAVGITWHAPRAPHVPHPFPAEVVETCPCSSPVPGSWPHSST